ncbi:MAG TPA: hypothetical protein VFP17_08455 [Solirubrobacterales bacterium]|nr:hypothetical protein [Solirubrobacterales bacterium]
MRIEKSFAVGATVVSVLASLRLVADFLGPSSAVLAGVGTAAFAVIASGAGLWLVGQKFIDRYSHFLEYRAERQKIGAMQSSQIDLHLFNTEVVPSFRDAGVERTKVRMLKLIDRLNLSPRDADAEREFVNRTAADESLSRSQRVELIVRGVARTAGERERSAGREPPGN